MLTVIPMGDLRRILSLRVKTAQKRIRVREKERESTMGHSGSDNTWIDNQVRLKAFTLDTRLAYILWRQLPTRRSIGRYKYAYNPGYKLLGQGIESYE